MDNIKGFIDTSFVDWPGRICAVLFLGGCNFRCPFCHNYPLVLEPAKLVSYRLADILAQLRPLRQWLGGICISGGEPTLDPQLPELLRVLRREDFQIKLDTNGSRPDILAGLIEQDFLALISMDVKTVLTQKKYDDCAGTRVDLAKIRKSIRLLKKSGVDHEFRMTVLPRYHSREDICAWAEELGGNSPLKLQNFNPRVALAPDLAGDRGFGPDEFAELVKVVA